MAGPGAVAIAKKLASGKAGGIRGASRGENERRPIGRWSAEGGFVRKPDLAQGSIPDFAATDAKAAAEKLRKLLA